MGDDEVGAGASGRHDGATQAKRQRRQHRGPRRNGVGRWFRQYAPLLLAAVVLVAAVGFGTRGLGPLGTVDAIRRLGGTEVAASADDESAPNASSGPTSSTSTTITLSGVPDTPGSCLVWDQTPGGRGNRLSDVVPCDDEHLFEVTSAFTIDGSPYAATGPTDDEWHAVIESECRSRAADHLGYSLDPEGRFSARAILPTPEGWALGDRHVVCGLGSRTTAAPLDDRTSEAFRGAVGGADQTLLRPTGTCIGSGAGTSISELNPCDAPHELEVVGVADLSALGPGYPGAEAIDDAARIPCRAAAEQVYGGPLPATVLTVTLGIRESSWAAGRRAVECVMGRSDGTGWVVATAPVRAATTG